MSASGYRARADALARRAGQCSDPGLVVELEATAQSWRRMADVAELQDEILAWLAAGEAEGSATPDDL